MISSTDLQKIAGKTIHSQDGQKIGKIVDVYESTDGSDGSFVTVSTGLFGGNASFVPLAQATLKGDDIVVPYDKNLIKDAPRVEADQERGNSLGVTSTPTVFLNDERVPFTALNEQALRSAIQSALAGKKPVFAPETK